MNIPETLRKMRIALASREETDMFRLYRLRLAVELFTRILKSRRSSKKNEKNEGTEKVSKLASSLKKVGAAAASLLVADKVLAKSEDSGPVFSTPPVTSTSPSLKVSEKELQALNEQGAVEINNIQQSQVIRKPNPTFNTTTQALEKNIETSLNKSLHAGKLDTSKVDKPKLDTPKVDKPSTTKVSAIATSTVQNKNPAAPTSLKALISKAASTVGVDSKLLETIVMLESSGNVNAVSKTGAIGVMQFTTIAWKEASQKGGSQYGIESEIPNDIRGTSADPRFDPFKNLIAGAITVKEAQKFLAAKGIPVNSTSIYIYHNLGPTSTLAVYGKRAHNESTLKAIKHQGAGFTADNYLSRTTQRVILAENSTEFNPVFSKPVFSGQTTLAQNSSGSVLLKQDNTSVVPQSPSASPVTLAAADIESSTPTATASSNTNASTPSKNEAAKPQSMYRDRNGHVVAS